MRKSTSFTLDPVRLSQLRAIAEAKNYDNLSDLLADYVRKEIEDGTIPEGIPGVEITETDDAINVRIDASGFTLAMLGDAAGRFVEIVREVATGRLSTATVDTGQGVAAVKRQGSGVKITSPNGSVATTGPAIATDIANIIAKHAAAAPQP